MLDANTDGFHPKEECSTMIRGIWTIARLDLLVWIRTPAALVCAIIPPLGMALLLLVLTLSVGQQPVALVTQAHGTYAQRMHLFITSDTEAYALTETDMQTANRMLRDQEVAAIITIPPDFDELINNNRQARLSLILNNVDIDFADDIRRSVERSVGEFDAPGLDDTDDNQITQSASLIIASSPYRIDIIEQDLRQTNVDFLHYQILPVLILLILSVGLVGTALLCAQDVGRGTARYLALVPQTDWILVIGRLLGGFIASLIVLVPALVLCTFTGIVSPPADHWPALIALFAATGLCASGMGATLGALLHDARTVTMAASTLANYLFFLGGGFTTIAFLPTWLQDLSAFVPIRYAIDGMRQALFYPTLDGVNTDLVVLMVTALLATAIGSVAVRRSWSM
jgi:ABC-type multidrug transport system permease subunit